MSNDFSEEGDLRPKEERLSYEDSEDFATNAEESFENFVGDKAKKFKRFEQSDEDRKKFDLRSFDKKPLSMAGPFDMDRDQLFKIVLHLNKNWMEEPNITREELLEKYEHFRNLNKALYGVVALALIVQPALMMIFPTYLEDYNWLITSAAIIAFGSFFANYFIVKNEYYKWIINKKADEEKMRNLERLTQEYEDYEATLKKKKGDSDNQTENKNQSGKL
jgi:hypothetical protein